ncbi:DNA-binding response regulator [Gulosibacter macacae]|uniref:DNA-binding response regulator n=1 Tax=Gulosibacter macacae TaxID=2488791 RepID=A0A3P3W2M2_9MICO|nr:response regulator transcription factor [Gulosibacter macacae]RRJ87073.1 DNA-binding response regulator [Gulosibacter macacae]
MTNILIIEDEARIAAFITKGLKANGHASTAVGTGNEGIDLAASDAFDLIVLDIGLPDLDGFSVLDTIRGMGVRTPVIILTARSSVSDTVHGLETGADDYMATPFRFEELLARIRLRLRVQAGDGADAAGEPTVLTHDDLSLDLRTHRATVAGREIDLSAREFALAQEFLRHPGQALTREQLLSRVWGYDFDPASNVVDVYVRYLRRKLGTDRIETVRGVGYRLV